jgi:hypothetical protein
VQEPIEPPTQAKIFWDMDNVRPSSVQHTLLMAHRLCQVVSELTAATPQLTAYANQATLARLGSSDPSLLAAALQLLNGQLVPVKTRRWAARRKAIQRCSAVDAVRHLCAATALAAAMLSLSMPLHRPHVAPIPNIR